MRRGLYFIFTLFPYILAISPEQRLIMDRLEQSLNLLCPGVDICGNSTTLAKNAIFDKVLTSCCKSCSCAPDCIEGTCCFNETKSRTRPESTCLYPMAYEKNFMREMQKYYIVDSSPEGGCKGVDQSCNATLTYVWGDILPVISNTTNLIYKTPQCAKCHGLSKEEYERWDSEFACVKPPDRLNHFSFFNSLLRTQDLTENCAVAFFYRGQGAYTGDERCYYDLDLSSDCKSDFKVHPELNMTRSEIEYACKNGPRIPFSIKNSVFKFYNVYCYICFGGHIDDKLFCGVNDAQIRNSQPALTTLLRTDVIDNTMTIADNVNDEVSIPLACMSEFEADRLQISNASLCREIRCPLGQIRDADGSCVFFTQTWSGVRYVMLINIHIQDKSKVEAMSYEDMVGSVLETLNLPPTWENNGIFAVSPCDDLESKVPEYTLSFIIDSSTPLDKLITPLIKITDRSWMFDRNENRIDFTVSIDRFINFKPSSSAPSTLEPVIPYFDVHNITKLCYKVLKLEQPFSDAEEIPISKMLLCEQVALLPNEYRIFEESYHTVLSYRNRLFFTGELAMDLDENGERIAIICLEDSGLIKVTQNDMILQSRGDIPNLYAKTAFFLWILRLIL